MHFPDRGEIEAQLRDQREKIARDLHDGIGSQLTHIISRLDMIAYRHQALQGPLSALRDFASETVEQLRETIWVLNQTELTFGQLAERMRGLLARISAETDDFEIEMEADIHAHNNRELSPQLVSSVFRIMQEGVNNAIKHARPRHIAVSITLNDSMLTLRISDDGHGFDPTLETPGNGLTNMRKRAQELEGRLSVRSSRAGTHIVARFWV